MFSKKIQLRWADIEANNHLRHSAYYDFAATVRVMYLVEKGLTTEKFHAMNIGLVLLREEAVFRREIRLEDEITVDLALTRAKPDFTRWSLRHQFFKADGTLSAIINIDCAWIDIAKRKFAMPTDYIVDIFTTIPKSDDFVTI